MTKKEVENSLSFIRESRRAHDRFPFTSKVTVFSKHQVFKGKSFNLSIGGIFISITGKIDIGDKVQIKVTLPGVEENKIDSEVRWILPKNDNEMSCGLKFLNLNSDSLKAIISLSAHDELRDV